MASLSLVLSVLLKYKFLLYLSVFILIISAAFEGVGIGMLVPVLQSIEGKEAGGIFVDWAVYIFDQLSIDYNSINLIIFFGSLILTRFILLIVSQRLSRVLSATITRDLRAESLGNLLDTSITYFYNKKIGDLVATIFNSTQNSGGFAEYLLLATKGIVFCFAYIIVASLLSLELTLFIITIVVLTYAIVWPRFKKSQSFGEKEKRLMDAIISVTQDRLSGIRVIKSFNKEKEVKKEFKEQINSYKSISIKIMDNKLIAYSFFEPFLFFLLIVGIIFSLNNLDLPMETLVVCLLVFTLIIPQFKLVNSNIMTIRELFPHFQKVEDLITTKNKSYVQKGSKRLTKIKGTLDLKEVTFSYSKTGPKVLNNFELSIPVNSSLGLVGPSGAGKSTLVDMLLKNLEPDSGKIKVNGIDLTEVNLNDWKKLSALVDQDPYLFHHSIKKNIEFFSSETSMDEIIAASKQAFAHDFITKFNDGYDTEISLRGLNLSGGQRQRISLARALVKKPQLLILDEATSALDNESEQAIQRSLDKLKENITLIVIAHNLSTIMNLDKIVFVEKGKVTEQGTHEQLIHKDGPYKKYVELHFGEKAQES